MAKKKLEEKRLEESKAAWFIFLKSISSIRWGGWPALRKQWRKSTSTDFYGW
jgi:hypothetical protein